MTSSAVTAPRMVQCAITGCSYTAPALHDHILEVHKITPEQYTTVTNGAPLSVDDVPLSGGSRRKPVGKVDPEARVHKEFDISSTFGIDLGFEFGDQVDASGNPLPAQDENGKPIPRKRQIIGYTTPGPHTPEIDHGHVFPVEDTKAVLLGIAARDNILIVGETGAGKTSLIEQVAARINYNVVKISFDGSVSREHLLGEWIVKGREMAFQRGILLYAMTLPGTIILLDEWDTIDGDCAFVLQRPLQRNDRKILLLENGGELITAHPDNVFAATANTVGHGDDSGLYSAGTRVQNYAQINRFSLTIRMQYMPEDQEVELLRKKFKELDEDECKALVRAVNAVRDGFKNGQVSVPLSPRDTLNWAEKFVRMGDPARAAQYAFINRMVAEDARVVHGIITHTLATQP